MKDLSGGRIETSLVRRRIEVGASSILVEAKRLGLIASTSGYRVVTTMDAQAAPSGFYAYNARSGHAVNLGNIIAVVSSGDSGRAEGGKIFRDANGNISSGNLAFADAFPLGITIDSVTWTGLLQLSGSRTPRRVINGDPIWLNGPTTGGFSGVGDNRSILKGTVRLSPATFLPNVATVFFPGVDIDDGFGTGIGPN